MMLSNQVGTRAVAGADSGHVGGRRLARGPPGATWPSAGQTVSRVRAQILMAEGRFSLD